MNSFAHNLKKYVSLLVLGAFLGIVLCSLFAPGLLRWYAEPVVPGKPFTCEMEVQWAARAYVKIQWIIASLLGVLFALVGGFVSAAWRWRKAASARPPTQF